MAIAKQIFTINTILPGWAASEYFEVQGQFLTSLGVDPEMPKDDSTNIPSGLLRPTSMAKFSASAMTGVPVWMDTTNKDLLTYVYANDGKVHTVSNVSNIPAM